MTDFIIKKLPYNLSSHAGLALVGKYLKRINAPALIDPAFPVRSGVANSDLLKSYIGLLCLGKNDFDAIENFRDNKFFMRALGLRAVPSSPTLRQRLDANASSWFDLAAQINLGLLGSRIAGKSIEFGALPCGYTPVDLDNFAMDNSGTAKELVGRTYAGVDGYCPFAVYLGSLGYCLELAPRPGVQHSALLSEYNFERALPMAAGLVSGPLLVRADSGFCSTRLMQEIAAQAQCVVARDRLHHQVEPAPRAGGGDELVALDRPEHAQRAGCADAPHGQAPAHQDGDAGDDVQGGPDDPACRALDSGSG
ncbi:MAG: transposase [Betaproteobacteria bacterium]|nr:transposase [Betaproteobacteria bacterium]